LLHHTRAQQARSIAALYRRLILSIQAKRWQWAAGVLIGIAIYSYIGLRLWRDWSKFDLSVLQFRYEFLGLSWLAHSAGTLLAIWTWMLLLRQLGRPVPFTRHLKVYTAANLARRLPGFVWWLVGRAYMYDHDGVDKRETVAASVLETVLIATAACTVVAISMAFPGLGTTFVSPFILIVLLVGFACLLHPRFIQMVWRRLHISDTMPRLSWRKILQVFGCEMLVVLLGGVALFLMLAAIYPVRSGGLAGAITGWALTIVASSVFFWLPFDLGFSSGVLTVAISMFVPAPVALVTVVTWRLWVGVCELVWSVLGLATQINKT